MWHERNSSDESAEDEDDDFKSDHNKSATNNQHNTFLERTKQTRRGTVNSFMGKTITSTTFVATKKNVYHEDAENEVKRHAKDRSFVSPSPKDAG